MFEMSGLQVAWWFIIGVMMIVYACTAGFDYGATMITPFLRKESDRRITLNAVGRTWDGNQTWLVFIGGALFVIWPAVYATIFSGFYAAMLIILWSLFLRPPGFDYRSKIESRVWRRCWDWGLFISAILPMFAFGLAIGNIMQGVPIQFDPFDLRPYYDGNFWGLVNWFGIVCGLTSVAMGLMHAAVLLHRRTEGQLKRFYKKLHLIFSLIFLVLFIGAGFMVAFYIPGYTLIHADNSAVITPIGDVVNVRQGAWILSYAQAPWKAYPPVFAIIGVFAALILVRLRTAAEAFWASCVGVAGTVATFGAAMFPFVVPSSLKPNESMTVWNAARGMYKLEIMLYIAVILLFFILVYKIFAYRAVWMGKGTLNAEDIEKNEHEFY